MEEEIWKDIEESIYYQVSNLGRVKRLQHQKWCKPNNSFSIYKERILRLSNKNTKKYWRIKIKYKTGISVMESVHRLVGKSFIPNPENKPQVNHMDDNKNNNRWDNLEWVTNLENMQHANLNGKREHLNAAKSGINSYMNKHSEETIRKIPELVEQGYTYTKIGEMLGIAATLITEIKSGRAWKRLNIVIPESKNYKRHI